MKNYKKTIPVFLLILSFHQTIYAQIYRFSTSGYSILEKNKKGKWGEWSDLELISIIVKLDTNKHRVIIYSDIIQLYEIINYHRVEESKTDIVYSFSCKDINGRECVVSIITRKNQGNRKQIYINYENSVIMYNIFSIED